MTATKISELSAATTIAPTDLIPIVSDPSGSPITKKITANNLAASLLSNVQITIVPNANVSYNLGSSAKTWSNVYLKTLYANGTAGSNGFILVSNGSVAYWSNTASFTTNVSAQYTFTNNITFSGTVTFTSNIIGTSNNSLYLGGTIAAAYVQNTDSRTLSGNLYFTGTNVYFNSIKSNNIIFADTTTQNTAFQKVAAPATSSSTGTTNQIAWDTNSIYICVSTNSWKKIDLTSF